MLIVTKPQETYHIDYSGAWHYFRGVVVYLIGQRMPQMIVRSHMTSCDDWAAFRSLLAEGRLTTPMKMRRRPRSTRYSNFWTLFAMSFSAPQSTVFGFVQAWCQISTECCERWVTVNAETLKSVFLLSVWYYETTAIIQNLVWKNRAKAKSFNKNVWNTRVLFFTRTQQFPFELN